jgi:thiamine pyrophosphokinase
MKQALEMKYLIVANGDFLPKKVILEIAASCIIVALDGAAERLLERGIKPQVILGDFDSLKDKHLLGVKEHIDDKESPYTGKHDITIVPRRKDQSHTDLQKAIHYVKQQGATDIHIVCAFSESRVDHAIFNMRLLRAEYDTKCKINIHGLGQTLVFVKNGTLEMHGNKGDHCGIFAFPEAAFSSSGLVWNGKSLPDMTPLQFGITESACNLMENTTANISISGEALITLPPQFSQQRKLSKLPEKELLHLLYQEACNAI